MMLKSCEVGGGGGCILDYNVSSGPFLSYEIEIGPGPELDNKNILHSIRNKLKGLKVANNT